MDHPVPSIRQHAATASRSVVVMIEANIASGLWGPGTRLPTERELEAKFKISRNTLRKSLKKLEASGKIVRHVGRGTFVAEGSRRESAAVDPLARFSGCSPADVMEVRLMLEPRAAELAAARASVADLQRISDYLDAAGNAQDLPTFERWDAMLHKTIVEAARNDLLTGLYEAIIAIRNRPEWTRLKERTVTRARRERYQEEHARIVSALRDRDARLVREEVHAHLLEVRANLLGE